MYSTGSITLPNDFGVVTSINSDLMTYTDIYILSDDTPVDNNNSLSMYFQYKLSGTYNWSNQIAITPTISGNKFHVNDLVLGNYFDHNQEYVFRVIAQDKLMIIGNYDEQVVTKATPIVRIGEEFVQVNGELLIDESSLVNQYSTSEIKTYKKWIDGKPIYRKVFEGQLGTAITHNIINANFINIYGFYIGSSGNVFPLPSVRPNYLQYACGIYVNNTQILFDVGSSLSNLNCYIVLEYTKTTD